MISLHSNVYVFFADPVKKLPHNVSLSMAEFQMRDSDVGLRWNVTSPCRLEAEVWLCEKGHLGGQCEEVSGSRQRLHNQADAGWSATRYGYWVKMQRQTNTALLGVALQLNIIVELLSNKPLE